MKVLLLSNINMQPLVRALKPWVVTCGAYNSLLSDLSIAGSAADAADVSHVICLYNSDALMGDAFYGAGPPAQCAQFVQALDGFCKGHHDKVVIVNLFSFSSNRWLSFADVTHKDSLKAREADLNAKLVAVAAANPNLLLLDLGVLFHRHGEDTLVSNAFWYTARIRYTARMFELLADAIRAQSTPTLSAPKKFSSSTSMTRCGAASWVKSGRSASLFGRRSRPLLPRFPTLSKGRNPHGRPPGDRQQEQRSRRDGGFREKQHDDFAARGFCGDAHQLACQSRKPRRTRERTQPRNGQLRLYRR